MITKEELAGIIDALGASTFDEIFSIVEELAYMREEEVPDVDDIEHLCRGAVEEHLIENVSSKVVVDVEGDDSNYYILGPNAFPDVPAELSEVIDILKLDEREVDTSRVAKMFSGKFRKWSASLSEKIDALSENPAEEEIERLEKEYSDLINLYYDFDFWLPGGISHIEDTILQVSRRIEGLKSAQDI